jgi:hypothetical protein
MTLEELPTATSAFGRRHAMAVLRLLSQNSVIFSTAEHDEHSTNCNAEVTIIQTLQSPCELRRLIADAGVLVGKSIFSIATHRTRIKTSNLWLIGIVISDHKAKTMPGHLNEVNSMPRPS